MRRIRTIGILCCLIVLVWPYAVKDVLGAVPFTFTSGTKAKADEVNANFNDLDSRLASFEGGQQGSTDSVGCLDKSPSAPDCSACTGTCVIGATAGSTAYPFGSWIYLAKYTLPAHGELVVIVGSSVVCADLVASDVILGISLAFVDAGASFPPANAADGAIAYSELTLGTGRSTWELIPWKTQTLVGRVMTQGVLTPGTTYKLFLAASVVSGSTLDSCIFVQAPVHLQFTPLPPATVTITPN